MHSCLQSQSGRRQELPFGEERSGAAARAAGQIVRAMASPTRIFERTRRRPSPHNHVVKKRPQQLRARTTFESIVQAAEEILAAEGYAALTTEHLATVAGVAIGSVYEYFASKEAIVAEVVRRMLVDIERELAASNARLGGGPEAWLRQWIRAIFDAVRSRKDLIRALTFEVPFLDEIEEVRAFPMRMFALAAGSPREILDIPYVSPASVFLITVMVRSAVIEGVLDPPPGLSSEAIEETLTGMLMALMQSGLSARRPRA